MANIKTKLSLPEAIIEHTSVEESSADPTKCSVLIADADAKVGQEASVTIRTVYENDQPCLEIQEVRADIRLEEGACSDTEKGIEAIICSTTKRGEYECKFVPTA